MIGIRCERGSHRFFKRYGERFEDSEGKQIFLEFADEERAHLELLIREYRSLVERQRAARRPTRRKAARRTATGRDPVIDLHLHTTASDGRLTPAALVARAAGARSDAPSASPTTTPRAGLAEAQPPRAGTACGSSPASRSPPSRTARDVHVLGYFIDPRIAPFVEFLATAARRPAPAPARDCATGSPARVRDRRRAAHCGTHAGERPERRPAADRRRARRRRLTRVSRDDAFDRLLGEGRSGVRAPQRCHGRRGRRDRPRRPEASPRSRIPA